MSYELEAEEQEQRREIEHRALEDFVAIAAHDLRQPLTVLHGRAQLLARRVRKEGQGTPLVAEIDAVVEQTKRAIQLSDVLLDIARIQAGDLELDKAEFDLVLRARRAVDEAQSAAPGHTFHLDVPGKLHISADERRLARVVTNLLANASKYAPAESGPVVLGISKSDHGGRAGSAELTVSDSGPGVS
ncbi:MAG TPA: HAMP domain-containing sensor histidine kinase, partial [Chloroflexia bacterium]|nr:HAMP domain-containing sensor histidine kinase [Chloroflexia bacterium]